MISIELYRIRIGYHYLKIQDIGTKNIKIYEGKKYNKKAKFKHFSIIIKLLAIILTFSSIDLTTQIKNNKNNQLKNGNRGGQSIKILHWNKGPSNFENKRDHLSIITDKYKPHLISLSEANYDIIKNQNNNTFNNYNIEFTDQNDALTISRQIVLVDKRLTYKRLYNLESRHDCTIWIEVILRQKKTFLFAGGYRQWTLPKEVSNDKYTDSKKVKNQVTRYKSIVNNWDKAKNLNKDIVITMDDNLDDSTDNKNTNYPYNLQKLYDIRTTHINKNDFIIHKTDNTYFKQNITSRPDHIYSNCHDKINNIQTKKTIFSDHSILLLNYNTKNNNIRQQYGWKRDKHLLTKHNLTQYFQHNTQLNTISNLTDANEIANIIHFEMDVIINSIAPKRRIQLRKNYSPYVNKDLKRYFF